ncbi:MAG: hypothetical protein ACKVS9_15640 [Phycisphaerae bacterium]
MATYQSEEARRLAVASLVCSAIGVAIAIALVLTAPPIHSRLLLLCAFVLALIVTKLSAAIATFTGFVLLIPVACTPVAMLATLTIATGVVPSGDNPLWLFIALPLAAYFVTAAVAIKME